MSGVETGGRALLEMRRPTRRGIIPRVGWAASHLHVSAIGDGERRVLVAALRAVEPHVVLAALDVLEVAALRVGLLHAATIVVAVGGDGAATDIEVRVARSAFDLHGDVAVAAFRSLRNLDEEAARVVRGA